MDLKVTFDDKTIVTPIYIKMNAHDQLLLSEGICSQLGILEYHKNVWPGHELLSDSSARSSEAVVPAVRIFRVSLSEPVTIPANKTSVVAVRMEFNKDVNSVPLLLEGSGATCKGTGLIIQRTLLQPGDDGTACLKIHNVGGLTERIEEGTLLGDAEEMIPPEGHCDIPGEVKQIRMESAHKLSP